MESTQTDSGLMKRVLDGIEKAGNKVPHPAIIFLFLMLLVVGFSHVLHLGGVSVTQQVIDTENDTLQSQVLTARSLLTSEGLRFIYTSVIPNFMNFTAVGLIIVAMIGVGVAEESGLIKALIRKLVAVSPGWAIGYILIFVGIISSIAADAGYLVLIPLAGSAFLSVGRHPIAGLAAGFAAVAGAFTVNMLIKPLDAVLTEFTNDAIHLVNPNVSLDLTANLWFSIASVIVLTVVITFITQKIVEPRLGKYEGCHAAGSGENEGTQGDQAPLGNETRGLMFAGFGLLAVIDILITGAIAKWALFAPTFVPLLLQLGVAPESVLSAYRIADSPMNVVTPLNPYFALVVVFMQKYNKNAGVGTVVALMLPYVVGMFAVWTVLFVVWFLLGLPWGL